MILSAVYLGKKVSQKRAKAKEERQGQLEVGDSDVAKRAFAAQSSPSLESDDADVTHRGTAKFEDADDVAATSPDVATPDDINSPNPQLRDTRRTTQVTVSSPALSKEGMLEPSMPSNDSLASPSSEDNASMSNAAQPPPYSARARSSSLVSSSNRSADADNTSLSSVDTSAVSIRTTGSGGTQAIRIKTVGSDLKSGFPYHPALFDLKVHPEKWTAFTSQIVDSAKFSVGDHAQMWASATAVALTGFIGTSVYVGRTINRTIQEKRVKEGLDSTSDGALAEALKQWNEGYFRQRGLFVHLELSESAMKRPAQKSRIFRKATYLYTDKDEREKKRDERKFVIVVTRLDEDGAPTEALHEVEMRKQEADDDEPIMELPGDGVHEIGTSHGPDAVVAELPGDDTADPIELPAESVGAGKTTQLPAGYVEMDGDNSRLMERLSLSKERDESLDQMWR